MTRLEALLSEGQSPWLDYIRRSLLTSGDLRRMVEIDGITGATTNPTIFEKAIAGSHDYDEALKAQLRRDPHLSAAELFERLAVEDVTMAADVFRSVFDRTKGKDGFVSLEVSPRLAHDTPGTVAEARRLWGEVRRSNLLIKVPATKEGIPAIEQLLSEGINVNITLMFSLAHYEAVAEAYLKGLAHAPDPAHLASVASVFVSRIDTAVDRALDASKSSGANALRGTIAIANAKVIYAHFQKIFHGPAFARWTKKGAHPQRVLWASTSTKDPTYRDTRYVEELVGPDTVNTIPPATLTAFEDHGAVNGPTLTKNLRSAREQLKQLAKLGIDLHEITENLQVEGVAAFAASYDQLLATLETKKKALLGGALDPQSWSLGKYTERVDSLRRDWQKEGVAARLWRRDPTLWPAAPAQDVADRMGWLELPEIMQEQVAEVMSFADEIQTEGIRHVVVLGMGGSSLAPDVFRAMFGGRPGFPELIVLDSTHPDAVGAVARRIDPLRTLFLVSSKSGTTLEPLSFYRFFWEKVRATGNPPERHFVAITDPGTPLAKLAAEERFRAIFRALPTVGGRYSALTMFGLVPAALIGVDVRAVLNQAWTMAEECAPSVPVLENPGLGLGAALGELATHGRDKLTFYASRGFAPFPVWVEQLVAESTGKIGKGIVPVVDEPRAGPETYGSDRLFVEIQESGHGDPDVAAHVGHLEAAGHPVVHLRVSDRGDLGQEFFRWELAVASSGMVLGINPFDQPDVELAKDLAREAMAHPAGTGSTGVPTLSVANPGALHDALQEWMGSCRPGDYVGIQAYIAPTPEALSDLQQIRRRLLERLRIATTLGFGPRFLHSTGQLHKGGPNTGLFLQIVDSPAKDVEVPGAGYTFGQIIRAQALGDYQALQQKHRRVLRVDLGSDAPAGLRRLVEALHD
jgi:transaldolase / glucose-6-phosphate isomerase